LSLSKGISDEDRCLYSGSGGYHIHFDTCSGVQALETYSFIQEWTGPGNPWGIAVDSNNNWVYAANHDTDNVSKTDTNGVFLWNRTIDNWGIAVDKDGFIYADGDDFFGVFIPLINISRMEPQNGHPVNRSYRVLEESPSILTEISILPNGGITKSRKFDKDGNFVLKWGARGSKDGILQWS